MIRVLFLGTLAIGLLAQWHVKRAYARHSRTPVQSGYTGAKATHEILRQAGITNVSIVEHEELLGDHYDPRREHPKSRADCGRSAHALSLNSTPTNCDKCKS